MPPTTLADWIGYDPFDGAPPKTVVVYKPMPKLWWVSLVAVAGAAAVVGVGFGIAAHTDSGNAGGVTKTGVSSLTIRF